MAGCFAARGARTIAEFTRSSYLTDLSGRQQRDLLGGLGYDESAVQPVDQTTYGIHDGNCFPACVASILEIPLERVPRTFGPSADFLRWLNERGLSATLYKAADFVPRGYAIAAGPSKRFANRLHACVAYDGRVVHDPHFSREGLPSGIVDYVVLHGLGGEPMWFSGLRSS